MINKYTKYLLLVVSPILWGQVGIGITDPQADLHIGGDSSTIRIEAMNSTNSPYNNGTDLAPVFIDGTGTISLGNGNPYGDTPPFDFLQTSNNFIPDDPYGLGYGTGTVINNDDLGTTYSEGQLTSITVNMTQDSIIEVKYGITLLVSGYDLTTGLLTYPTYGEAFSMGTFFVIDIDSDGLSPSELSKRYGHNALSYDTDYGGIIGYAYLNGQGYLTLPEGIHEMYFYGTVEDHSSSYTSVGFGGVTDFLKIRIYN